MLPPRLSLALDEGLIDAPVALIGPDPDWDLSALPGTPSITTFRQPDHDLFAARGYDVSTDLPTEAATIIVFIPRERALARRWIARAMEGGQRVLVDGDKTDGIDGILKSCRSAGEVGSVLSKAHGKLFALEHAHLEEWLSEEATPTDGFATALGGFSSDGIDPGSAALADALPPLKGSIADLGAGWGYLSHRVLKSEAVEIVHLVEAYLPSLDAARHNVGGDRAVFHWADATVWSPPEPVAHVVMNPPFHKGRKGAPDLGRAFIANASRVLTPRGTLWMVANRHLPYEAQLSEGFAEVAELPGTNAFKLYRASRPRRKR